MFFLFLLCLQQCWNWCCRFYLNNKILSGIGIKTNVTLVFSTAQALMAVKAGVAYVSLHQQTWQHCRRRDFLVKDIATLFKLYNILIQIITASIRTSAHVTAAARAGSDIATIPYKVFIDMLRPPLTASGIEKFLSDWDGMKWFLAVLSYWQFARAIIKRL